MKKFQLVHKATREPVKVGDTVISFRGDAAIVSGFEPPRHAASSGRIYVKASTSDRFGAEYYPSVFDCEIVEVELNN